MATTTDTPTGNDSADQRKLRRLARRLTEETRGEARLDDTARSLYATDASLYEIAPVGVFLPRSAEDVGGEMAATASRQDGSEKAVRAFTPMPMVTKVTATMTQP